MACLEWIACKKTRIHISLHKKKCEMENLLVKMWFWDYVNVFLIMDTTSVQTTYKPLFRSLNPLLKSDLTCWYYMHRNRREISSAMGKQSESVHSSWFYWHDESKVLIVNYQARKNENVSSTGKFHACIADYWLDREKSPRSSIFTTKKLSLMLLIKCRGSTVFIVLRVDSFWRSGPTFWILQ